MTNADNPKSRDAELVVQNLNDEVLIYDLTVNKAYTLNAMSAAVWRLCNGKNSVADISIQLSGRFRQPVTDELVYIALDQLKEYNLLADSEAFKIEFNGLSRRQVIKKVGLASMVALPVVAGITAPTAAQATSGGGTCATINQCIRANTVAYCPASCSSDVTFIDYRSTNGSCTNVLAVAHTFNCSCCRGIVSDHDVMRVG